MIGYAIAGVMFCFLYGFGLFAIAHHLGVKYTDILDSEENIKNGVLVPVGFMSAVLFAITVVSGWLPLVFRPAQTAHYNWMWIVPAIMLLSSLLRFKFARWSLFSIKARLYMLVGVLLVGFSEELLTRGILVYFTQRAGASQAIVMLVSAIVFGVLHGMNYFNGQDAKTTRLQIFLTAEMGLAFYISLIVSGTLWLPIFLHALFDLSLMVQGGKFNKNERKPQQWELGLTGAMYLSTVIAAIGVGVISWG